MANLNTVMTQREMSYRYLTIGFSSSHDAVFLNKIAQAGSEQGNFFYIDTGKGNYQDDVKECLNSSLNMASAEDGLVLKLSSDASKILERLVLAKTPVFKDEEEKKEGDEDIVESPKILQPDEIQLYDFIKKINLKEQSLADLKAVVLLPKGE
jgi:hypothetical protein